MRHNGPEYSFIASVLSGHRNELGAGWDWDRFIAVAAREGVIPALYRKFPCPAEVRDFLDAIHEINSARNRQLLGEVEEAALILNRAGIEPVLLKGAAYLAAGLYEDPATRFVGDIDLLVPEAKFRPAVDLMVSAGYEPGKKRTPGTEITHHFPTLYQAHRFPLEIHRRLGLGACDAILKAAEVLDAALPLRLGNAAVRLPSRTHLMTHLILHSQVHHSPRRRIWPTLQSMLDLVQLSRQMPPDWNKIRAQFAEHGKSTLLKLHLLQICYVMDIDPPFPLGKGGLRWLYRRALWRETRLKYLDPTYLSSRLIGHKLSSSARLLKHPGGIKYFLATPFRLSFYRNLLSDWKNN